jgi:hypothetical protein
MLRHRLSSFARLGVVAVVGTLLVGVPVRHARAADDRSAELADDVLLTALGEQLVARPRAAGERLRGLVEEALTRTVERVHEARRGMERVITLSHELEELASAEASAVAEQEPAATDASSEPKRPRRLEYVESTNDPLAGL